MESSTLRVRQVQHSTAETPPTSLIETFAIPPGNYLPSPDIVVRGDAGTAVAGRERQLAEISTTTDVFKFLIRLGYNANGHAVTLAILRAGHSTVHDRPFSIPDRGKPQHLQPRRAQW